MGYLIPLQQNSVNHFVDMPKGLVHQEEKLMHTLVTLVSVLVTNQAHNNVLMPSNTTYTSPTIPLLT